jgi:tetratricopeptide (TPR) repeat protein
VFNPFPGLRPFEPDEDHLFFGREAETADLLRRLRSTRFVSVIGTSGSGKSSLVRSGLVPTLQGGFMVGAGSSWRIAMLRPGESPIGNLAAALAADDILGPGDDLGPARTVLLEATLHRSSSGLVDAVRQARIPRDDNLLLVVDQFEELFRFRRSRRIEGSRDEAAAFVKLILEATKQNDIPIFVVLTMRSDFIGDCMDYPGLPEAVNAGQFLVPRLTRDELRSAITGPVAVGGGTIAPRLVLRLLKDLGDDQDQLPLLQHVLMRTWEVWAERQEVDQAPDAPIDIADYEAVGGLRDALSRHAEEAYVETGSEASRQIVERLFKALTDRFSDHRGVRRPTSVRDLAAICEATEAQVIELVDIFRRPGRSFLMPPASIPLRPDSIVDLSHESLMRCWTRLIGWAEEERVSAAAYHRLSQASAWHEEGTAGLWRNPELELALAWRRDNRPTAAWARRYDDSFERAMSFLDQSAAERTREERAREWARKRELRRAQWAAGILAAMLLAAVALAYVAWRESARAEMNLSLARDAVDQTLASSDRDPTRVGADVPQMEEFRRELLGKAQSFYLAFLEQSPRSEELRRELAFARFRLGHISRLLEKPEEAAKEYQDAIASFESLSAAYPGNPEYRQALANSYNWLGETLRPFESRFPDARRAYDSALRIQEGLLREAPESATYQEERARTLYNRGILLGTRAHTEETSFRAAESDFRAAIALLEPLTARTNDARSLQELARAYNNLASLIVSDQARVADALALYERAIAIDERLVILDPRNRDYKLELAKFCNNLAYLLRERGELDRARKRSDQALALLENLASPVPSLGVEQADAHNLRGLILQGGASGAEDEFRRSLEIYAKLARSPDVPLRPEFHLRFGELLLNLAAFSKNTNDARSREILADAVTLYGEIARKIVATAPPADMKLVLENLARLVPELAPGDRPRVTELHETLERELQAGPARRQ